MIKIQKIFNFWILMQIIKPFTAFSGVDQPWNDSSDAGGDPSILGYLIAAGLVAPVLSKLFHTGPWKENGWLEVGISGIFIALTLILVIQIAIVAIIAVPIYLLFKFFIKYLR
jgi:hypothetical protein